MGGRMKSSYALLLALATTVCGYAAAQDADYEVPRTEYGQPDLQGVWNFSSSIPMQRPERFGEQEFLTPEQIEAAVARQQAAAAAADAAAARLVVNPDAPEATDNPGG